jgi:hypothetical protein
MLPLQVIKLEGGAEQIIVFSNDFLNRRAGSGWGR